MTNEKIKDIVIKKLEAGNFSEEKFELDFNHSMGDTLKEKFSSIAIEIAYKSRSELHEKSYSKEEDFNWLFASPEITSIFETSTYFDYGDYYYHIDHDKILCGSYQMFDTKWYVIKTSGEILYNSPSLLNNKLEFIVGSSNEDSRLCKFTFNNLPF